MHPEPNPIVPSVDPAEVARYTRLAERWWDPQGPFWPLHTLNRLRSAWIRDHLCRRLGRDAQATRPLAGLSLVDIGCGGGLLSEAMARMGARVHGVDVTADNITVARRHARDSGLDLTYEVGTTEALAQRGACYDVVLNMEVVEHVAELPGFMAACNRLLRLGGHGFIATLNRTPASFVAAIVGAEYLLRWLPRGTHQWRRFRKPRELEALLARDGVRVVEATGVRVNPFTRRMTPSRSMVVNYMLMTHRPEGDVR